MRSLSFLLVLTGLALLPQEAFAGRYGYENGRRVWYVEGQEADGGEVNNFINRINRFRREKTIVVIRVPKCQSSCGLYTALIKYNLVCASPGTMIVFHRPFQMNNLTYESNGDIKSFDFGGYAAEVSPAEHNRFWTRYPIEVRRKVLELSPTGLPGIGQELSIPARALGFRNC